MNNIKSEAWLFNTSTLPLDIKDKWDSNKQVRYAVWQKNGVSRGDNDGIIMGYIQFQEKKRSAEVRKLLECSKDAQLMIAPKHRPHGRNFVLHDIRKMGEHHEYGALVEERSFMKYSHLKPNILYNSDGTRVDKEVEPEVHTLNNIHKDTVIDK